MDVYIRFALPVLRSPGGRDEGWMLYALSVLKKQEERDGRKGIGR